MDTTAIALVISFALTLGLLIFFVNKLDSIDKSLKQLVKLAERPQPKV
jgi:hypothetical protein